MKLDMNVTPLETVPLLCFLNILPLMKPT